MPSSAGSTQICSRRTGRESEPLNSLCRIPVPALIRWASPGRISPSEPVESLCKHRDSTGSEGEIRPGEAQRMSAGTGILHSEFNGSDSRPVRLLQIWVEPAEEGMAPGYEQKYFPESERLNRLRLIASQDGREGSVTIGQDAAIYNAVLSPGAAVEHPLSSGRAAWVQVAKGAVTVNGLALEEGDGAALSEESAVRLLADRPSEVLVFDLN